MLPVNQQWKVYLEILEPVIKSNISYVSIHVCERERDRKELEITCEIVLGNSGGNGHLKVTQTRFQIMHQ